MFNKLFLLLGLVLYSAPAIALVGGSATLDGYISIISDRQLVLYSAGTLVHVPMELVKERNLKIGKRISLLLDTKTIQALKREVVVPKAQ